MTGKLREIFTMQSAHKKQMNHTQQEQDHMNLTEIFYQHSVQLQIIALQMKQTRNLSQSGTMSQDKHSMYKIDSDRCI